MKKTQIYFAILFLFQAYFLYQVTSNKRMVDQTLVNDVKSLAFTKKVEESLDYLLTKQLDIKLMQGEIIKQSNVQNKAIKSFWDGYAYHMKKSHPEADYSFEKNNKVNVNTTYRAK